MKRHHHIIILAVLLLLIGLILVNYGLMINLFK